MKLYRYQIELHDAMYYATREIGRLFETAPIIHNYALCYAFGLVKAESYRNFCAEQVPQYQEHLEPLNQQGLYVSPASPIRVAFELNTWKIDAQNGERYTALKYEESGGKHKNIPSWGRNKEISPESCFEGFIVSAAEPSLPRWIRLGKWLSKAELSLEAMPYEIGQGQFRCPLALNPIDTMLSGYAVASYDSINMPPASLIKNVTLTGHYAIASAFTIPLHLQFRFKEVKPRQ